MPYCDANGRTDPNGKFEIIPRRKLAKDGEYFGFDLSLMDNSPDSVADAYIALVADLAGGRGSTAPSQSSRYVPDQAALDAAEARAADAYAEMVADMASAHQRPPGPQQDVQDRREPSSGADSVRDAYEAMVADLVAASRKAA